MMMHSSVRKIDVFEVEIEDPSWSFQFKSVQIKPTNQF